MIIPFLSMKDRFNIATTCRKLYQDEANARQSYNLEHWNKMVIYVSFHSRNPKNIYLVFQSRYEILLLRFLRSR